MFYEEEEGEGREVREGGTSEREILSIKAAFFNSERRLFFVIPLVISADIRAQKMWVSGVSE